MKEKLFLDRINKKGENDENIQDDNHHGGFLTLALSGAHHATEMDWGNGNGPMMGWDHNPTPMRPSGPAAPGNPPATQGNPSGIGPQMPADMVWLFPYQPMSGEERFGLIQMRQEMELTRDVPLAMYNRWQQPAFLNSANTYQTQIDAMKTLRDKYGIADPVADNIPGVFSDPKHAQFYLSMVAQGMVSPEHAWQVGAAMGEMAFYTVNGSMTMTDRGDMQAVCQYMMVSSQNHMRTVVFCAQNT